MCSGIFFPPTNFVRWWTGCGSYPTQKFYHYLSDGIDEYIRRVCACACVFVYLFFCFLFGSKLVRLQLVFRMWYIPMLPLTHAHNMLVYLIKMTFGAVDTRRYLYATMTRILYFYILPRERERERLVGWRFLNSSHPFRHCQTNFWQNIKRKWTLEK